jgi:hypothetical protein
MGGCRVGEPYGIGLWDMLHKTYGTCTRLPQHAPAP